MGYTEVQFVGSVDSSLQPAFTQAVDFWNRAVLEGFGSFTFTSTVDLSNSQCGVPVTIRRGTTLTGLRIFASTPFIDGRGSVLGRAGPCLYSERLVSSNFDTVMPVLGIMEFDSADADALVRSGQFADVVVHEMGHVLGIGTLWDIRGDLENPCSFFPFPCNPEYSGENGRVGYREIDPSARASDFIPVENTGGTGTKNGHWRESTFENELMTGFLNSGIQNPLSIMTVESLKDQGYVVDLDAAQDYALPNVAEIAEFEAGEKIELLGDILNFPIQTVKELEEEFGIQEAEESDDSAKFAGVISVVIIGFLAMAAMMFSLNRRQERAIERMQVENGIATRSPMHLKELP